MKSNKTIIALLIVVATSIFSISAESASQIAVSSAPVNVSDIASGMTFSSLLRGLLGIISIILIAVLFSRNRRAIDWKVVGVGLLFEIAIAALILYVPFVQTFFELISRAFIKIISFTHAGSEFLFGSLLDINSVGYIFVFQVVPVIIFFSALTSLLYYLNIIQVVVKGVAWLLKRALKISGAEGLIVAGNIFLGQTEAPMLIKRYLPNMNRSELLLVMSVGMATISGSVLTAYISLLGGSDINNQLLFAKYLLMASVMAAPGVIILAKIVYPQTENVDSDMRVEKSTDSNLLDAISNGGAEGVKIAVGVVAMLLVFISIVALLNYLIGGVIGEYSGLNTLLSNLTDGKYTTISFELILGVICTPLAWLMGVPNADILSFGGLVGTKLVLNEFVAYSDLSMMKAAGEIVNAKTIVMATFALCGFANLSSIGIQIGGLSVLAPNHRKTYTQIGFLALLCGALASFLSATIIGIFLG